jgi:ferric-dicitrate binding protein FerR (iron transport regulator)
MSEKRPYQIPDFLVQNLNEGQAFTDADVQEIESIFSAASRVAYPDAGTEANWQLLRAGIEGPMTVVKKPARNFAMFRWAAAAIVVLTIGIGVWQFLGKGDANFTAVYKTGPLKQEVRLPDGTVINLNAYTELEVKTMNVKERIVALKNGEAFFDVVHNELPFKVQTGKGDIVVMGTCFNIKNRQGLPFSVFLKTGKVLFTTAKTSVEMRPGQCLKQEKGSNFILSEADVDNQCAWLDNKLVFKAQPLSEIIKELESYYQVKFVYDHKLESDKYNFVCENSLDAQQVAQLLTKLVNSKVTVE